MVRGRGRKARDDLCSRTDPRMRKYVHIPKSLVTREKEDPPTAPERPARGNQVPHSLLARRHGEDPEVRDAEVRSVKPLPPRLPVGEELAPERGLREALACNRHGAAVSFKEEVPKPPMIRLPRESQAEDPIRLHPEAVELAALLDLNLPPEG